MPSKRAATTSIGSFAAATYGSRWAASRRSCPSTTWTAPNGTSPLSVRRKRGLAGILIRRLKEQFAPGGLLHFGQGKWYPGESLPRWALGCWWRRDGLPIWKDDSLIADETVDYGHGEAQARRFIMELAEQLGVGPQHAIPAYEDVWHYLWRERRLPVNVDPLKSELKDEEERARLSRIFEQGLEHVVGYVLPLAPAP